MAKKKSNAAKHHIPFLKRILEDPDDLGNYAVYADWLQEHRDPRGQLMSLQLKLEDEAIPAAQRKELKRAEQVLLKEHSRKWLKDLAPYLIDQRDKEESARYDPYSHSFARGFLDTLEIGDLHPNFAKTLGKSPHVRMLRRLIVRYVSHGFELPDRFDDYEEDDDWDFDPENFKLLSRKTFDNLRHFEVRDGYGFDAEQAVSKMPRLETLHLELRYLSTYSLFEFKFPHLVSLTVHNQTSYRLNVLAKNKSLKNLESLSCWPHALAEEDTEPYIKRDDFRKICRSKNLSSLKRLSLHSSDIGDEGVEEMISSGLLVRLVDLDLEFGCITDEGAKLLAEQDLSGLERLNVATNYLTKSGISELKKTCKECSVRLDTARQLSGDPDDERQHLYYGDME